MNVGDLHSDARGTGARANSGKPDLSLIPLRVLLEAHHRRTGLTADQRAAIRVLGCLARWQERQSGNWLLVAWLQLGPAAHTHTARVFDYGRRKYRAWNWAKGMPWSVPLACATRHIVDGVLAGEHLDPESGLPHAGHVGCNLVMLMTFERSYREGDDRAPAGMLAPADRQG